jgi:hypothetical protein
MPGTWTFAVARADLAKSVLVDGPVPDLADGEALLRVDRVGVTANNVTYAVLGDSMRYWEFFPPEPRGLDRTWGLGPLWGFADVAGSTVPGVEPGQRVYGYLPPAGHLVVKPGRADATGFRDTSAHRAELPSPYNAYRLTTGDPAYRAADEDLLILFRPLFYTSFMLADQLIDQGYHDASALVFSSASSKTAYAAAFELRGRGPRLVGLTSAGNVEFTRSLGCYDEVLSYDEVASLDSGSEFFFAPVQMRKRTVDWGREGLDERFSEAWHRFVDVVRDWVDVQVGHGPDALRAAWLDTLAGRVPPNIGHVIQL